MSALQRGHGRRSGRCGALGKTLRETVMLAQFADSGNDGAAAFGVVFVIASIGWVIFVVWWMLSLKTEIQRIRETIEHRVYDFDQDEDEDEDEEPDDIEQLSRLSKLRQEGALTDEEFAKMKAGLLGG